MIETRPDRRTATLRRRGGARVLLCALLFALAGCAGLPQLDPAYREQHMSGAVPLSLATTLGRIAKRSQPSPEHSGFRLMPLGNFSLDTRIQLARRAEATLDVQYYDFENDETGRSLIRALAAAADCGVRVRLLIDDLYTGGHDDFFLGFATHPNVQVRLFNPFCCSREQGQIGRFAVSIGDWSRVNHRMHNKLFIADGAMAVIGGRNVANEYFLRGTSGNFVDVDAFTVGQVVPPLENLFDRYWNSAPVFPLEVIGKSRLTKAELRAKFDREVGPAETPEPPPLPPNDILGYGPLADDLDGGRLQSAYRVRPKKDGSGLEWFSNDGDKETILTEEPDSSRWLRFQQRLLTPFVPEELL